MPRTSGKNAKSEMTVSAKSLVPLNFRVPMEFRKEFKIEAAGRGIDMKDLMVEAFRALKQPGNA